MSEIIKLDGITFECDYYVDEDYHGDEYVVLETVKVNGQDISGVISEEWWEKLEKELTKDLEGQQNDLKLDAELSRLEAYGI